MLDALRLALTVLSDREAGAFRLRYLEGASLVACGAAMGVCGDRVDQVAKRALGKVRSRLRFILGSDCGWGIGPVRLPGQHNVAVRGVFIDGMNGGHADLGIVWA
jgi:hypothetical protein